MRVCNLYDGEKNNYIAESEMIQISQPKFCEKKKKEWKPKSIGGGPGVFFW